VFVIVYDLKTERYSFSFDNAMALIRPRLTDHFRIPLTQDEADFAIPFLDEDIPLCVDPFLLWKSPSQQDQSLHTFLLTAFNHLGWMVKNGSSDQAERILMVASECEEVALGFSGTRKGSRIGAVAATKILTLFSEVPQIAAHGFSHFEEIQLYVDQIGRDRISDITCNLLKSFLIDYTIDRCEVHGIPTNDTIVESVYVNNTVHFRPETVKLPTNPNTGKGTILVPKRWLRSAPWISQDQYISEYFKANADGTAPLLTDRVKILNYNRHNYDLVQSYVKSKERVQADCRNDPLFKPIPVLSIDRKIKLLDSLPSGKENDADKKYEDLIVQIMASMLYPHLDFAQEQVRTDSGVLIRDLVFYNNRKLDFLADIYDKYGSQQIVMEMKNVKEVDRDHLNQLNRYLNDNFGKFGILITRNDLQRSMFKNTVDLWSGQRRCILVLTDADVRMMADVFASKQRLPIEVIKAKYIQFMRSCPS
jgi:hypothetical protein